LNKKGARSAGEGKILGGKCGGGAGERGERGGWEANPGAKKISPGGPWSFRGGEVIVSRGGLEGVNRVMVKGRGKSAKQEGALKGVLGEWVTYFLQQVARGDRRKCREEAAERFTGVGRGGGWKKKPIDEEVAAGEKTEAKWRGGEKEKSGHNSRVRWALVREREKFVRKKRVFWKMKRGREEPHYPNASQKMSSNWGEEKVKENFF